MSGSEGEGRWHRVTQSESAESIATQHGLTTDKLWRHPNNAPLRSIRETAHVLLPGDLLFVPNVEPRVETLPTNAVHQFRRRGVPSRLRVRIAVAGEPVSATPFVLRSHRLEVHGQTDGDGWVDVRVPARLPECTLTIGGGDEALEYTLRPRALDPCSSVTGWQSRLANLGFDPGEVDGVDGPRSRAALSAFQLSRGLPATGEVDDATRSALIAAHGS